MVLKEKERIPKLILLPSSIDCRGWSLAGKENLCECYECKSRLFYVRREWGVIDIGPTSWQVVGWKDKSEPHLELQEIGLTLYCAECGTFVDDYSKFCYPKDNIICSWDDEDLDMAEIEELHWAVYAFNTTGKIEKDYESAELKLLKSKIKEYYDKQKAEQKLENENYKKWITDGLTDNEIEKMTCKHGSFTCGLLQKLGIGMCPKCKADLENKKI